MHVIELNICSCRNGLLWGVDGVGEWCRRNSGRRGGGGGVIVSVVNEVVCMCKWLHPKWRFIICICRKFVRPETKREPMPIARAHSIYFVDLVIDFIRLHSTFIPSAYYAIRFYLARFFFIIVNSSCLVFICSKANYRQPCCDTKRSALFTFMEAMYGFQLFPL